MSSQSLRNHIKVIHEKIRLSCDHCHKIFKSNKGLQGHIRFKRCAKSYSDQDINFKCDQCDTNYTSKNDLQNHFNVEHPNRFLCEREHCNKSYATKKGLQVHVKAKHNNGINT